MNSGFLAQVLFSILLPLMALMPTCAAEEELGVKIERNVPVPMRDGTILRADVYRPDRGGPYPVLVQRTPYGKGGNFDRFVKAGYIVVSQDERGRHASEGRFVGFYRVEKTPAEDGYDTIEWAAGLSGSNGKVGTFGRSAPAGLQWRLAALRPPSLVAMLAESVNARVSHLFPSGINRPQSLTFYLMTGRLPEVRRLANQPGVHTEWEALRLWEQNSEKWINWLPWLELPLEGFENDEEIKFWWRYPQVGTLNLDERCKDITVPNLDITGWYDKSNSDMLLFRTMVSDAKTEVARKKSQIIIGPWTHTTAGRRRVGDFHFGPDASVDIMTLRILWFDYWLKGKPAWFDESPPVRIFVMGDNKWRDEMRWPLQRTKKKILFTTSRGRTNAPRGCGGLTWQKGEKTGTDQYVYDPRNPVPTPPGIDKLLKPVDQHALAGREDILVYQSEPLAERIEVTGNPTVELYAASSAPDTDWFVRLIDVAPDGLARSIAEGVVRARYRHGPERPTLLKAGELVKYVIHMSPTSNAFLRGHRIRLDITSSDFPNYDRNHNTGADQNADATLAVANQTIYHGGEQATRIILPWVPNPMPKEEVKEERLGSEPDKQLYLLHQAAGDGDVEQVRLLVSGGADINAIDEENKTPLHYAAETGKTEVTRLLVEAGADIKAKDKWLWSSLHYSTWRGHRNVAEYLISGGAEVNAKDNSGLSPLHYAARQGHRDIAELLTAKGADINAKDDNGTTPLSDALFRNQRDVAELLFAKGGQSDSKDGGLTALHNAAVQGYQEIAELLLSKGAKVDERDDNYEFTPLHYAARFGTTKVAEVLIAHGADIKAKDKWAYEPIHWAAYHDRPEIIELLIAKGADVNVKTSLGQTPLELAMPRRNTATIEALRKHGGEKSR